MQPASLARFEEWLAETGLTRHADLLRSHLAPAIGLRLEPCTGDGPPNGSRWGGSPATPADFVWPTFRERPLDFLLQVALEELRGVDGAEDLPAAGSLAFFFDLETQPWGDDPDELAAARAFYFPDRDSLVPTSHPTGESLPPRTPVFYSALTLPDQESAEYQRLNAAAELSDDEFEEYVLLNLDLFTGDAAAEDAPRCHLLGHAAPLQGDMTWQAQMVSHGVRCDGVVDVADETLKRRVAELLPGVSDWRLLLQLDSDADLAWADGGRLYFWIRRQDLAAANFDKIWAGLQEE